MSDNKDYKDLVILAIAAIGISIAWFAYLVYIKDRERDKERCMRPLSQLNTLSPTEVSTRPVYDERLYQLLENQQNQLEYINSNINSLRSLNYTSYKMPNQRDVTNAVNIANMNKLSTPRAGSVTTIRTTTEDKTRQRDFGMI